jgi:hypothetical protein
VARYLLIKILVVFNLVTMETYHQFQSVTGTAMTPSYIDGSYGWYLSDMFSAESSSLLGTGRVNSGYK